MVTEGRCVWSFCFFWFSKSSDTSVQRFDKSLEEFYALCDQLELCLVRRQHNTHSQPKCCSSLLKPYQHSFEDWVTIRHYQLTSVQRLAYECLSQSIDSAKHSPNLVPTATKPDTVQTESMSYTQYLGMIKSQISCAKDIHNALLECSKKISGKGPPQGIM